MGTDSSLTDGSWITLELHDRDGYKNKRNAVKNQDTILLKRQSDNPGFHDS
jgi:hypothetical protein